MAYQSLYRKYRPQTFADVVGQEHVTRTLQNAIQAGRIGHGYLFTGTRGTAKTTVARLLAKALNCDKGPAAEPCNQCDACTSITGGSCIDVIEMDAASHRGVADIEEVRKAVGYGPMQFRYKVFIIDEAHQLSSDAKDAFLKTLEEPPDNVVFILATTEPQAIPITIRSRCQQFDFKRGSLADIAARVKYVCDREGVASSPSAINLVARGAEGSYRDALSLLEQVLAFSPKELSPDSVDAVLGTLDAELLSRVTEVVSGRDAPGAFALAGQMLDAGKEARTLLRTLSAHFRDLLLVSVGGPAVSQEMTQDEAQRLQAEARRFVPQQMLRAIDILNEAQGETRWNNQHRLLVELTFLKLMNLGDGAADGAAFATAPIVFSTAAPALTPVPSPNSPGFAGGRGVPAAGPTAAAPGAVPIESPFREVAVEPVSDNPLPTVPAAAGTVGRGDGGEGGNGAGAEDDLPPAYFARDDEAEEDDEDDYTPGYEDEEAPAAAFAEPEIADPAASEESSATAEPEDDGPSLFEEEEVAAPPAGAASAPAPATGDFAPPKPSAPPSDSADRTQELAAVLTPGHPSRAVDPSLREEIAPAETGGITLEQVERVWPRFLRDAEHLSKRAAVMLQSAVPTGTSGKMVTLTFTTSANHDMMSMPKQQEFVRKLLARCLGVDSVQVRYVLNAQAPVPPPAPRGGTARRGDLLDSLDALDEAPPMMHDGFDEPSAPPPAPPSRFAAAPAAPPLVPASRPAPEPVKNAGAPSGSPAANGSKAEAARAAALEDPLVQEALSIFGGEIVNDDK